MEAASRTLLRLSLPVLAQGPPLHPSTYTNRPCPPPPARPPQREEFNDFNFWRVAPPIVVSRANQAFSAQASLQYAAAALKFLRFVPRPGLRCTALAPAAERSMPADPMHLR